MKSMNVTKHVTKSCCLAVPLTLAGLPLGGLAQNSVVYGDSVPNGAPVVYPEQLYPQESRYGVIKAGPVNLHLNLTAGATYDDNITIQNVNKVSDYYFEITPGFRAILGENRDKFVTLSYRPRALFFMDETQNDSVDHNANLAAQWNFNKLTLAASQGYQLYTGNEVDAGARVDRSTYVTTLGAAYSLSEKTSFELNLRQNIVDYGSAFSGYNEWVTTPYMNYQITPKVKLGAGVTVGALDTRGGPNQVYEQLLVRAAYKATDKIDAVATVGGEFRQFQGGENSGPDPVLDVGVIYRPREKTQLKLSAYHRQQVSVGLNSQNYELTGINGSIIQQFREKWSASALLGFEHANYSSTLAGLPSDRTDDYFYAQVGLNFSITTKWSAGAFYTYRKNDSSGATARPFSNNQVGLQTTLWY